MSTINNPFRTGTRSDIPYYYISLSLDLTGAMAGETLYFNLDNSTDYLKLRDYYRFVQLNSDSFIGDVIVSTDPEVVCPFDPDTILFTIGGAQNTHSPVELPYAAYGSAALPPAFAGGSISCTDLNKHPINYFGHSAAKFPYPTTYPTTPMVSNNSNGCVASASSVYSAGYPAYFAFDNSLNTFWYSAVIYNSSTGQPNPPLPVLTSLNQTSRSWTGMTILGNNVYCSVYGGDIYKQTNGTGNFVALGQTARNWRGMGTLGNNVYCCVSGGDIYMQTNGTGNFVALGQTARNWEDFTTLGNDIYCSVYGGDIYKQTNGTGNFVGIGETNRNWTGMTTLGNNIYCAVMNNDIYKQTNGTGSFVPVGSEYREWRGMTTANGNVYAIGTRYDVTDMYAQYGGQGSFNPTGQTGISNYWYMTTLGNTIYCAMVNNIYTATVSNVPSAGEWLKIQLPRAISLSKFTLTGRADSNLYLYRSPSTFTVDASNNGTTWTTIYSASNIQWSSASKTFILDSIPLAYSYYRLTTQVVGNSNLNTLRDSVQIANWDFIASIDAISYKYLGITVSAKDVPDGTTVVLSGTVNVTLKVFHK